MKKAILIALVFLVFAGCTPKSGSIPTTGDSQTPDADKNLVNTSWRLVSFGQPSAEISVIEDSNVTLQFNAEGKASGSGSCNSYSAQYQVKENLVSFGEINHTLMACEQEGIDEQEQNYLQALETAGKFALAGDHMTIWYDNGQGVLNWVKSTSSLP
jgi:heat shock protein HslJ